MGSVRRVVAPARCEARGPVRRRHIRRAGRRPTRRRSAARQPGPEQRRRHRCGVCCVCAGRSLHAGCMVVWGGVFCWSLAALGFLVCFLFSSRRCVVRASNERALALVRRGQKCKRKLAPSNLHSRTTEAFSEALIDLLQFLCLCRAAHFSEQQKKWPPLSPSSAPLSPPLPLLAPTWCACL
jgi:hypothetical protein